MNDYLTIGQILKVTGGRLIRGDPKDRVGSFSTDTRTLQAGDLFIALKGPNFDGHDFVGEALRKEARGAIVSADGGLAGKGLDILLQVEDTLSALGDVARLWRGQHPIPLAAITGSTGKTTTKEWASQILSQRFNVLSSSGTHNNLIGLPLTLLGLRKEHQIAVVELGMNAAGEIRRLSYICQPDMGLITNVGPAHLEFLGSLEGVAAAKAEMLDFLRGERASLLNGDDPYLRSLIAGAPGRCFTYGLSSRWDFWADGISAGGVGIEFLLHHGGRSIPVRLPPWGRHSVYNALASAAIAARCGLSLEEIREGLGLIHQLPMRMEKVLLPGGVTLLNDSYNANPMSMRAALSAFFEMKGEARGILVLGDMLELGSQGEGLHREIGGLLSSYSNIGALIVIGPQSRALAEEASMKGLSAPIHLCQDRREASSVLEESLKPGDWVLLKGSRAMRMEKVLEDLRQHAVSSFLSLT
jgi:UDP-N-acetylmuramoyl-tripeptide--D-alanyl-D-alanine ligase